MNLLDRDPVRRRWLSHLNLELCSRRDRFGPTTFLEHANPNAAASETDSAVTSTECRIPEGAVKLTVHVRSATAGQRSMFAIFSPKAARVVAVGWHVECGPGPEPQPHDLKAPRPLTSAPRARCYR